MTNAKVSPRSIMARRFVAMGLASIPPEFPPAGVPLVELSPWWGLWPRNPRTNCLVDFGAAVFPAAASQAACLKPQSALGQAVFAALLPLHDPATAVARWTNWTVASMLDESYPGPGPLLAVLEALLRNRAESEQIEAWSQILDCAFDKAGEFPHGAEHQGIALLEAVGRSGWRALSPLVSCALQNDDEEMVFSAVACLARMGVPDAELPAEILLNRLRPEMMERARGALAFVETGDVDLLSGLLRTPGWGERIQVLRLVEAVLARGGPAQRPQEGWRESLADLLLAQLQQDDDSDVVRCLAVPLGLALRQCGEAHLHKIFEAAAALTENSRMESLMDALLLAELPPATAARVEALRGQVAKLDSKTVRALNRVLMSLGEPSGTARDWLEPAVVVFLQLGVLRLPDSVRAWFDSPAQCPEAAVAAWLIERPDSGLALSFCGAYLAARPGFLAVLERIWMEGVRAKKSEVLQTVGGLLAGAADDCAISPVELRCCLGHEIGGPLEESPEMLGQLLGLLMTQNKGIRASAEELLRFTSPESRIVVGSCLRWMERNSQLFEKDRQRWAGFGGAVPLPNQAGALSQPLQPLFANVAPICRQPDRLLAALALPDQQSNIWVRACVAWKEPDSVQALFAGTDSPTLVASFLQASAGPHAEVRQLAGWLAAGVGPRLLETSHRERIIQRIIYLAAHDPDAGVRPAGRKAAEALGIADLVPVTPPPENHHQSSEPDAGDQSLDELLNELGTHLED